MTLVALVCPMPACGGSGIQGYRPPDTPSLTGVISYGDGATVIDRRDSAVDEAAMTGSFDVTRRFGNAFGQQVLKETFAILDCSRK